MSVRIDALGQTTPDKDYLFSAVSWLSVVIISCWMGWLLGSGCSVSRFSSRQPGAELRVERPVASVPLVVPVALEEREDVAVEQPGVSPAGVEGTLADAAHLLSELGGAPVVLTAAAESIAHCPSLTVPEPGAVPDDAHRLLRDTIEAAGFSIEQDASGTRIDASRDALFLGCRSKQAFVQPTTQELDDLEASVRVISRREREMPRDLFAKLGLLSRSVPSQERVVPYYRDGEMLGVKIYVPVERGVLGLLGFEDGDVITHVAGQPLETPSRAVRIPSDADKFVVRVLRDGAAIDLHFKLVDAPSSRER